MFSKTVHDGKGNILGFERDVPGFGKEVTDKNGNRLGSTTTFGTFDKNGDRKSDVEDAGFLIDNE